jgi:hypothetical protein
VDPKGDLVPATLRSAGPAAGEKFYRVQDCIGRGPFRPGFSAIWADEDFAPGMLPMPTWMEEFGVDACLRLGTRGESFGSAVRTPAEIGKWFSYSERNRLRKLGFRLVEITGARVLAESENQALIASPKPFRDVSKALPWSFVDRPPLPAQPARRAEQSTVTPTLPLGGSK